MTDTHSGGEQQSPIDESDRCDECGTLPKLIEEASVNPLTGDEWNRYKCDCEYTTVRVPHE